MGSRLKLWRLGLSPSTSGSRAIPCGCSHQCNRRAFQVRDGWLQGQEAGAQRQPRAPPERDGHLLSLGRDRKAWLFRSGLAILSCLTLAPFRNRLRVDPQLPAQQGEQGLRSFGPSRTPKAGRP
jgi:hypothetical protein